MGAHRSTTSVNARPRDAVGEDTRAHARSFGETRAFHGRVVEHGTRERVMMMNPLLALQKARRRPGRHPCLPSSIFLRSMAIELKSNPSAMPMTEYTPPMMAMREVMKE